MPFDVFISYATPDKATADAICHRLESEGVRCWIAPRNARAGRRWASDIDAAIQAVQLMVLVFSGNTSRSSWVIKELTLAAGSGLPILPFRIEPVVPESDLKLLLADTHWLDALTEPMADHIEKLADAVNDIVIREQVEEKIEEPSYESFPKDETEVLSKRDDSAPESDPPPESEVVVADSDQKDSTAEVVNLENAPGIPSIDTAEKETVALASAETQIKESERQSDDASPPQYKIYSLDPIPLEFAFFPMMIVGFGIATIVSNSFMNIQNKWPKAGSDGWIAWVWEAVKMFAFPFLPYICVYLVAWWISTGISEGPARSTLVQGFVERMVFGACVAALIYTLLSGRDWLLYASIIGAIIGAFDARSRVSVYEPLGH